MSGIHQMLVGGSYGGGGGLSFTANHTSHVSASNSFTLPSSGVVGDIAVLTYITAQGTAPNVPSGWTEVSYTAGTGLFWQMQRSIVKILTPEDLGVTLPLASSSVPQNVNNTYLVTFTPSRPITLLYPSSVDEDFSTGAALPTRTKDTTAYNPPNIVFAAASNLDSDISSVFSGVFWDENFVTNDTRVSLAVSYEVQPSENTDRDVTPSGQSGQSRICHSFVLNAE